MYGLIRPNADDFFPICGSLNEFVGRIPTATPPREKRGCLSGMLTIFASAKLYRVMRREEPLLVMGRSRLTGQKSFVKLCQPGVVFPVRLNKMHHCALDFIVACVEKEVFWFDDILDDRSSSGGPRETIFN
ncbi:MAG: hypothetical protein E5X80_17670 [Mesorhizobium sp.]|uniref:hypothetical protein n=1 Tax=Mesorhizobium sp. TaxID=1871066 RepID=UPI0012101E75|nr:hypothetical protein [Mesorhizobium sp.]TIO54080.1 MAG: hypothetical protein E5X78_04795 [Mesorhizobium sp.]TIO60475.1 MAG: hypothetical protein E5X79_11855 [Mesorhizobium sp.]TJV62783.1 MAG: hypothetical protein E5X80_17670 [Mesorhizobium sp.]